MPVSAANGLRSLVKGRKAQIGPRIHRFCGAQSGTASGTIQNGAEQEMSLKAKLEAVIYAAEEPVTLGQLAVLFAEEALEWKAEQEAASEAQAEEPAVAETENLPLLEETLAEGVTESEAAEEAAAESTDESADSDADGDAPEAVAEAAGEEAAAPDAGQAEAEAKRAARLREREARGVIKKFLDELVADCAVDGRGIEIREIAGGYRMATKPECHDAVRSFIKGQKPPLKLSLPALETLAVIAYKQPVTAPEVNEIRGVDSSAVFGSLLARKLIATAGRKPVIGRRFSIRRRASSCCASGSRTSPSCRQWKSSKSWQRASWKGRNLQSRGARTMAPPELRPRPIQSGPERGDERNRRGPRGRGRGDSA